MKTNMIYGRYCSLLMCFTLSLAAQDLARASNTSKFGTDERMCDVFVNVDGRGKMVPGTIVGATDAGWEIAFPYETNRGSEKAAGLSQKELSQRLYQSDEIETNLRFLNDEDLATLKQIDESAWKLYQTILGFRNTHKNGGVVNKDEETAVWAQLVPILFERFTTVNLKERKQDNKLEVFQNLKGRWGTDWHKDYNDMGFTMMIDDSFVGSPLIYWPGKEPQAQFEQQSATFKNGASGMFDIEYVQGGKYRVTSVNKDLEAYNQGMRVRDLILEIDDYDNDKVANATKKEMLEKIQVAKKITFCKNSRDTSSVTYKDLPHSDNPSQRTYEEIQKWCEEHNMKIAPEGTKIALFEGKKTLHGRSPIPEDTTSSRGLAFYAKEGSAKKFLPKQPKKISAKRKNVLEAMLFQRKKRKPNTPPPSALPSTSELRTGPSLI